MPRRPADPHPSALGECPGPDRSAEDRTRWALARALELGFHAAGVCRAVASSEGDRLHAWLDSGKHGAMGWMREHVETRLDVRALHPGARSVLVVLLRYADGARDRIEQPIAGDAGHAPRGRVARYARGPDYHDLMKRRLGRLQRELERANPGATGRRTCDIEPVMERELAVRAGLGLVGKHTLLISPGLGSWTLIATLATIQGRARSAACACRCGRAPRAPRARAPWRARCRTCVGPSRPGSRAQARAADGPACASSGRGSRVRAHSGRRDRAATALHRPGAHPRCGPARHWRSAAAPRPRCARPHGARAHRASSRRAPPSTPWRRAGLPRATP
ncbi:MAG: DUF1730 domain-containing protein, partial [Phycisphaerales bacterium]|nr:DUF1730 domain-containing protein [Phycisphaerales bacterium]